MPRKAPKPPVRPESKWDEERSVVRSLPVPLEPLDVAEKAARIAALDAEIEALEDRRRALNSDINEKKGAIREACKQVRLGADERQTNVAIRISYSRNEYSAVRIDTGQEIENRPLTAEERQSDLPLAAGEPEKGEGRIA